jgi:DNA processing protein
MASAAWLTLLQAAQSASPLWLELLRGLGSAEAVVAAPASALLTRGLPTEAVNTLKNPDRAVLERWEHWLRQPGQALVTLGSADYPARLATIPDPPLALWRRGAAPTLLGGPQLAIVGSRSPTGDGRDTATRFARYLAARGLTVTSGLATGVDGASHEGAVGELGGTVAVLGSGLDVIFPRQHDKLAAEIAARGVLVSEYAPEVTPQKHFFPQRNRIIAGLSLGTLVVEATRRSGSLITARRATEYGREVFAIPGSIHNPLARGCHHLIRQGAKLVEEAADILVELAPLLGAELRLTAPPAAPSASPAASWPIADPAYRNLLSEMGFSPISIADLSGRCQLTTAELSSMLLVLELEGLVEALPGGRYSRLGKRES